MFTASRLLQLPRVMTRFNSTTTATTINRPVAAVIVKRGPCDAVANDANDTLHSLHRKPNSSVYLLVKKPRKDHAWGFPQGGIDPGESIAEAALRELREECGNDIKVRLIDTVSPSCVYQYRFPDEFIKKSKRPFTGAKVEFMQAEWVEGQCSPDNHEIVDFAWVTLEELEGYIEDKGYKNAIFSALKT